MGREVIGVGMRNERKITGSMRIQPEFGTDQHRIAAFELELESRACFRVQGHELGYASGDAVVFADGLPGRIAPMNWNRSSQTNPHLCAIVWS